MIYDENLKDLVQLDDGSTYLPIKPTSPMQCTECVARNDTGLCAKLSKEYDCGYHKVVFVPFTVGSKAGDMVTQTKHEHYFKDVSSLDKIDVYRIIDLYQITDPCIQHSVKKLLVAGGRGHKDIVTDIQNVIDTLERWKEMQNETSDSKEVK